MGAEPGAAVAAQAAEGRADGIEKAADRVGAAERYNESLDKKQELVGSIVDMGLGHLTYGGEVAGQVAGVVQEQVFDHYRKDPEEIAEEVIESRRDFLAGEKKNEADVMKEITKAAGRHAGVAGDSLAWTASRVHKDVEDGFSNR
ncbi:hypothetical protein IHE61_09200 [Streptomyces sp. GKU 257-1]|nr:hypothetical protein [Streptomyces sp. GKU 257-1]